MSVPKLYYFDGMGRGESTRLLFAAAGAKFEDIRFDTSSFAGPDAKGNTTISWPEMKPKTPFGQVPVLEVNGKYIAQSRAIERYVAREYGLFGSTVIEGALIDQVQEQLRDLYEGFGKANALPKEEQAAAKSKYISELGEKAASLAAILEHNKSGFFVGSQLSMADVLAFNLFHDIFAKHDKDAYTKAVPKSIQDLVTKVGALPNIAAHVAARPVRPF